MARRKAMKSRFWIIALAIMLLALPAALAKQEQHQRHYQRGDVWVGCVANAQATTLEKAFFEAASIGNKESRSCWVSRQTGWWIFRKTKKMPIVTFKKYPGK
jgi:hypothetical protein